MYARDVESALKAAAENPYWREADAVMVLSLWRDSGQTLSAFARQYSLSVQRLRRWHRRLEDQELPKFHPVQVVPDAMVPSVKASAEVGGVEIALGNGRRLIVRPGFDEATLARVLQVLESLAC